MIKNILKINGTKALTKTEQFDILGGTFSHCEKFTTQSGDSYLECYHIEREAYVIYNMLGSEVSCDEIYNH